MADETTNTERLQKHTLFPIIASNSGAVGTQTSLLFPCVSVDAQERGSNVKREDNQQQWLRNESYKDVISGSKISDTEQGKRSFSIPEEGLCNKRSHPCIASSDEESDILDIKETQKKPTNYHENKSRHHKDKKKHKQKKKHKHKHGKSGIKEHTSGDDGKPDTIWLEEANVAPEKAFRLHRKPDVANRMYSSLYRLDIALYKLKSNVMCLGLGKHQVIDLFEKKGAKKKKIRSEAMRYWNISDVQSAENSDGNSTILFGNKNSNQNIGSPADTKEYISLRIGEHEKGTERSSAGLDAVTHSYDSNTLTKTAELNKFLQENPHDISSWLELANFQEEVVQTEGYVKTSFTATGRERRKASTRTVIEKKIAVFEKALQQNPNSLELIVAHLNLCGEIMDAEELLEKWKKVSFVHPNNTLLWRHYLIFMQSRFSLFSFGKVATIYGKCFSTLSSIKEGTFTSHQAVDDLEVEMLDLFLLHCQFTRQSGHTEKAIACMQAMVELNCFCSPELEKNTPVSGQLAFLETFWDSGAPRFGEKGAKGWKTWMAKNNEIVPPEVLFDFEKIFRLASVSANEEKALVDVGEDEIPIHKDQSLWKNWLTVEFSRERKQLFPWQPDRQAGQTEEDCDDPERLVLFDDISSSLFKIKDPTNKLKLVLSFFSFLGIPVPCLSSSTSVDVQRFLQMSLENASQILEPNKPLSSQFLGLWQSYHWRNGTFCEEQQWPTPDVLNFVRHVFVQSLPVFSGKGRSLLMVSWLWFEFQLTQKAESPTAAMKMYKDVRKLAKCFLKQLENRNNLLVWQVYAEMEWLSGNTDEAHRVFDSTLLMGAEMFPDEQERKKSLAPLFRSYAELEIGIKTSPKPGQCKNDGNKKALHILALFVEGAKFQPVSSTSDGTEVSSVKVLRCRRLYQKIHKEVLERGASQVNSKLSTECGIGSGSLAVHLEVCSVLFEYLSMGISSVLAMCHEFLEMSKMSGLGAMDKELIFTGYIRVFKFHCDNNLILPLKDTRSIILSVLEMFPDNPEFLSFYIQRECKSVLGCEVRRTLDRVVQKASTPVPWIFSLYYEQIRSQSMASVLECNIPLTSVFQENASAGITSLPDTGQVHRQYSLFERAVASSSGRHCLALWRMFMEFESKHGSDKVKSVFYQALQSCPWAKCLYTEAVQYFPEDMQDIVDMMMEKEIRLHAPLEEIELLLQE